MRSSVSIFAMACLAIFTGLSSAQETSAPEPETSATGLFVNMDGDVVTARHAVEGCRRLYVVKNGQVARAWSRAIARDADVAVLRTGLKPSLAATFPVDDGVRAAAEPVFAEAYSVLQTMPDRDKALFNALTVPGEEQFSLMSPVRPGASGSPVLDLTGHVLAMVVERSQRSAAGHPLSRQSGALLMPGGASEVRSVPARAIKSFLRNNFVSFQQSDEALLGHGQASASRAATVSVGVICGG